MRKCLKVVLNYVKNLYYKGILALLEPFPVINPYGEFLKYWNFALIIVIMTNFFVISIRVGYKYDSERLRNMDIFSTLFLSLNLVISMLQCFYKKGELVTDKLEIFHNFIVNKSLG